MGATRVGPTCVLAGLVALHACVQLACVLSASLGVRLGATGAALALGAGLAASAGFASRFTERVPDRGASDGGAFSGPVRWTGWVLALATLGWAAAVWLRLWLLALARPSYDWDGLYYHIPAIHEWAIAGRIAWIQALPDVPFVNYPMGIEAHTFFLHQIVDLSRLVDACNLWYWPLALVSVVVLAERLGARGPWRWLAGALVAGAPVLVCQSVTSYTDPASAACVMAAMATSLLAVFHGDDRRWWKTLVWGASLGLVLGSKGTGLPSSAALGLGVAAAVAWREGRARIGTWLPAIAAGATVALLVGGYWYARNAYHTGNPVHPVQVRFGARVLMEGYDASRFTDNNQPPWLTRYPPALRAPVSWLQLDAPIEGYAPIGGLGYIWLLFGIPGVLIVGVLAARGRPGIARTEVGVTLALALVLLAVQPAAWWARFVVWLHVVGLASVAIVLTRASSGRSVVSKWLATACALAVVAVAVWESERTLAIEEARGRVAQSSGEATTYLSSLQMLFPQMAESEHFDQFLSARTIARSSWGRSGTLLGGILAMPLGHRTIHVLPAAFEEQSLARLAEAGVRWVVWDVEGAGPVPQILRERAADESVFTSGPGVAFHVIRLAGPEGPVLR